MRPGPLYTTLVHRIEGLGRSEVQVAESVGVGAARSNEGFPFAVIGLADAALVGGHDDGGIGARAVVGCRAKDSA